MERKIDSYAYKSKLRKINPEFKVIFAFLTLLICIIADNIYVSLAIIVSMGFITIFKGGIKFHEYMSLMSIPLVFMILGSIAIVFGVSMSPIGDYNLHLCGFYLYTSDENIMKIMEIVMKAFGAISAMYMMTLSTNTSEIISVLRKAHIPKIIIELMNMIYRFIFILIDVQCKMKNSAQSRLGYIDFKTSCYSFGSTASNLLIVSLKKANTYYNAMESRCYNGDMLFLEEEKKVKTIHVVLACIYFSILIFIWYIAK
ncbi:cobalt ECF transporter T component CbiQ [Clostridium butyricum]|uniref:cobalt ECF transporter T component CbiQ n=1 Tax=Clostridium butyricum TaxID=1492 RepID=UPI002ABE529D|nr:cobalt ECF transporter T component CbiQ [Clostridium butyricum]